MNQKIRIFFKGSRKSLTNYIWKSVPTMAENHKINIVFKIIFKITESYHISPTYSSTHDTLCPKHMFCLLRGSVVYYIERTRA